MLDSTTTPHGLRTKGGVEPPVSMGVVNESGYPYVEAPASVSPPTRAMQHRADLMRSVTYEVTR